MLMFQVGPTIPDKTGSRLRPDKGRTLVLQVEGLAGGGGRGKGWKRERICELATLGVARRPVVPR